MAEVEGGEPQDPGKKKLDAVAHCREDSRKTLDIDFSCVHAASKSYCVTEKACSVADSATFATRQAEEGKLKKYGHLCAIRGHILLPIVLNTYGGFGDEIVRIVNKHFDAKRAEEKATTGQEWVALAERELLFQRSGVAVARGNSAILGTLRHTWSKGARYKTTAGEGPKQTCRRFSGWSGFVFGSRCCASCAVSRVLDENQTNASLLIVTSY